MKNESFFAIVYALAAILVPASAAAGCVVVSAKDAVVRTSDTTLNIIARQPQRVPNCEGMKVISGQISACFASRSGQRSCSELATGATFTDAGGSEKSDRASFSATLQAFSQGDMATVQGATRAKGRPPGMPFGMVYPEEQLVLALNPTLVQEIENFRFETVDVVGAAPLTASIENGAIRLAQPLVPGTKYRWRATRAGNNLSGVFQTASLEDVSRIKLALSSVRAAQISEVAKSLLLAELFNVEGLPFNAYLVLVHGGLKDPD